MKRQIFGIVMAAGIAVLIAAPSFAQATDQAILRVPFQFVAGNTVLPAGTYTVRAGESDPAVLWIVSTNGRRVSIVATNFGGRLNARSRPLFQFRKYGDAYLLAQVAMPGESVRQVPLPENVVEQDLVKVARLRYEARFASNG
jgi:hypothetical protein